MILRWIGRGLREERSVVGGRDPEPHRAIYRTLRSTNPIENLNGSVADYTRNVTRWRGGGTILRWVGTAVVEA